MTFSQFKYLSEYDQAYILCKKKIEVARRSDKTYHYILYQVDGFYMEVMFPPKQESAASIVCFEDVDLIIPYLQNININSLFRA